MIKKYLLLAIMSIVSQQLLLHQVDAKLGPNFMQKWKKDSGSKDDDVGTQIDNINSQQRQLDTNRETLICQLEREVEQKQLFIKQLKAGKPGNTTEKTQQLETDNRATQNDVTPENVQQAKTNAIQQELPQVAPQDQEKQEQLGAANGVNTQDSTPAKKQKASSGEGKEGEGKDKKGKKGKKGKRGEDKSGGQSEGNHVNNGNKAGSNDKAGGNKDKNDKKRTKKKEKKEGKGKDKTKKSTVKDQDNQTTEDAPSQQVPPTDTARNAPTLAIGGNTSFETQIVEQQNVPSAESPIQPVNALNIQEQQPVPQGSQNEMLPSNQQVLQIQPAIDADLNIPEQQINPDSQIYPGQQNMQQPQDMQPLEQFPNVPQDPYAQQQYPQQPPTGDYSQVPQYPNPNVVQGQITYQQ